MVENRQISHVEEFQIIYVKPNSPTLKCGLHIVISFLKKGEDFPGGSVVKNPPANAGDKGLSPGPGRFHMPRGS